MVIIVRFRTASDAIDSRGMAGAQDTGPRGGLDRLRIRSASSLSGENYLEERPDFA